MYPVEIINKIKMQDAEAFRELVNMYGKRMYLRLYEKSGNREIALEAVPSRVMVGMVLKS